MLVRTISDQSGRKLMASYVFDACGLPFFILFSFFVVTCNEASMIHGIQTFFLRARTWDTVHRTTTGIKNVIVKVIEWLGKNNRWRAKGTWVNGR